MEEGVGEFCSLFGEVQTYWDYASEAYITQTNPLTKYLQISPPLGIKISTCEFKEDADIQSIAVTTHLPGNLQKFATKRKTNIRVMSIKLDFRNSKKQVLMARHREIFSKI